MLPGPRSAQLQGEARKDPPPSHGHRAHTEAPASVSSPSCVPASAFRLLCAGSEVLFAAEGCQQVPTGSGARMRLRRLKRMTV